MSDIIIDIVDLKEYYQLADEVVKKILDKETERVKKNMESLAKKGIIQSGQCIADQISKDVYQVSIVVATAILKKVLFALQNAEESTIEKYFKQKGYHFGDKDDVFGR